MTFDEFVEREALLAVTGKNPDVVVLRFNELREKERRNVNAPAKLSGLPNACITLTADDAAQYAMLQAVMTSRWRWKYASDEARRKVLARTGV